MVRALYWPFELPSSLRDIRCPEYEKAVFFMEKENILIFWRRLFFASVKGKRNLLAK